jgi:hypothetical protein
MSSKNRECIVDGQKIAVTGKVFTTARLDDEWYMDVDDPEQWVKALAKANVKADLFTFWQRLPDTEPRFKYFHDVDSIAVLPVTTYDHWLKNQINNKTRNLVGKAAKKGIVLKPATFDDEFVRGMVGIFNETPIRQGVPFWHYGKDFETIKREFSRYLFREELVGAYLDGELIGFIFLANAGKFAALGQIISMMKHRDKSPNNALIAKAVEMCAERKIPYLVYAVWPRGPLKDFKRHNGFDRVDLPRYYIPLTAKGELALKLQLHRKAIDRLPDNAYFFLRDLRTKFWEWKHRGAQVA